LYVLVTERELDSNFMHVYLIVRTTSPTFVDKMTSLSPGHVLLYLLCVSVYRGVVAYSFAACRRNIETVLHYPLKADRVLP